MKTDDKCQECKKDWTKCDKCPVMIEWVKEHRKEKAYRKGYHDALQRQAESEEQA